MKLWRDVGEAMAEAMGDQRDADLFDRCDCLAHTMARLVRSIHCDEWVLVAPR